MRVEVEVDSDAMLEVAVLSPVDVEDDNEVMPEYAVLKPVEVAVDSELIAVDVEVDSETGEVPLLTPSNATRSCW